MESRSPGQLRQTDLFVAGTGGYHTYRIPALLVSRRGVILALCEGRMFSRSDSGKIDILLRRSLDGGASWGEPQCVVGEEDMTCGNPCPVVDRRDGTIWLLFCKNLAAGGQRLIEEGKAPRTVWLTRSGDDGATWSQPAEITDQVKERSWTWYATGPGHAIQLQSGRLVMPCDHIVGRNFDRSDPHHSHVIYSDDRGRTWRIGGSVAEGSDESTIVECSDGSLYINCRNQKQQKRRLVAWSRDGGESFGPASLDETLVEPTCQASAVRLTLAASHGKDRVLFSNPASTERERMTIRLSRDECRTWPVARLLHAGPSAYSDLAVAPDMTICCLYECGTKHPYEKLTLARFDLGWLTEGTEPL